MQIVFLNPISSLTFGADGKVQGCSSFCRLQPPVAYVSVLSTCPPLHPVLI